MYFVVSEKSLPRYDCDSHSSTYIAHGFSIGSILFCLSGCCLKDVPEGRINISECHNVPQFFHYQMGCKNSKGTYINKENEELISALVQKSYKTVVLKKARIRAKKIKNLIKDYEKGEFESIYLRQLSVFSIIFSRCCSSSSNNAFKFCINSSFYSPYRCFKLFKSVFI